MMTKNFLNEKGEFILPKIKDLPSFDQYLVEKHLEEVAVLNEKELNPYQKFFQKMLDKYNVAKISDLPNNQKSKFFKEIKSEWAKNPNKKGG